MLLKRLMLRKALKNVANDPATTPAKRKAIEKLLDHPRAMGSFAHWLDDFAVQKVGSEAKVKALGDGTLLKLLLDNLPAIMAAVMAILKAFGVG